MKLSDVKMVKDEHTAYDEVIQDINSIGHAFLTEPKVIKRLTEKCKQLMRLLNDDDEQIL